MADCVAVGFPMYQVTRSLDLDRLDTAEVRGYIRKADATAPVKMSAPSKRKQLQLHDASFTGMAVPPWVEPNQGAGGSPFGGLSGALVFWQGWVLGHIVEHYPWQRDAVKIVPIERIADAHGEEGRKIADALGLPPSGDQLPPADGPVAALAGLVEILDDRGDLPLVSGLDPYRLGADPTGYGNKDTYGPGDPYVPRTVDKDLRPAMSEPGRLVLLVGPSKAGKTRTAFEAAKDKWPQARLAKPDAGTMRDLIAHPRVSGSDWPLVVWLDDLERYLTGPNPLTPAALEQLLLRPGDTVVVATLRREERSRLNQGGELARDARQLLDNAKATTFDLDPTSEDPVEKATAQDAYPGLDLSQYGLAEQLAGAPALLDMYRDANPVLKAVLQVAVDWQRTGMARPIPHTDLLELARPRATAIAKHSTPTDAQLIAAIEQARTPPTGFGPTCQVAALDIDDPDATEWAYRPYPYLVDADDDPTGHPRRIPDKAWTQALDRATPDDLDLIGRAAYLQHALPFSLAAWRALADQGSSEALFNMGVTLSQLDSQKDAIAAYDDLLNRFGGDPAPAVREQVARAMVNKGYILRYKLDSPEGAVDLFNKVVIRFGDSREPAVREQVAIALFFEGFTLSDRLHRHTDAVAVYDDLLGRLGEDPEPAVRGYVAKALVEKGRALTELDRPEEAVDSFDRVVIRFGDSREPAAREQVARALFHKGHILDTHDRLEEGIAAYDDLLYRFGDDPEPAVREYVARTSISKGLALALHDRPLDAIDAFNDLLCRLGDESDVPLRGFIAEALRFKGYLLAVQGQPKDAIAAFDDLLLRFGGDPDPAVREQVAAALAGKSAVHAAQED